MDHLGNPLKLFIKLFQIRLDAVMQKDVLQMNCLKCNLLKASLVVSDQASMLAVLLWVAKLYRYAAQMSGTIGELTKFTRVRK